jgi:hypothetical protein
MPKPPTPEPDPISPEDALLEWLEKCSFAKCGESSKRQLAAIARGVHGELSNKGILLNSSVPEKLGSYDSTAWTAFEVDLKRGFIQSSPVTDLILAKIHESVPISKSDLLAATRESLLLQLKHEDDADIYPEKLESQVSRTFEEVLERLTQFGLVRESGDPSNPAYIKLKSAASLESDLDTARSAKRKTDFRRAKSSLVAYVREAISRQLVESFQPESSRPLRRGGKSRTFKKVPLQGVSFQESPDQIEKDLSHLQETLSAIEDMPLDDPEPLQRKGREMAARKFSKMKRGKVQTLLLAYAAKFLDLPMTDKALLGACGVTHSGAPRNTLRRDIVGLRAELKSKHPQGSHIVAESFVVELHRLVIDWATNQTVFQPSVATTTPTAPQRHSHPPSSLQIQP